MSVLETPRIYFRGQISWDPIVTNNYPKFYDENDAETVFPHVADKVAAFRAEAIAAVQSGGNWNPHGTHRSTSFDMEISGVDLGAGLVRDDPFIGSPVNLTGMLVDLEPFGAYTSQLFFDTAGFGIDGGYRIVAPRKTRFTARYINFFRNTEGAIAGIGSVVWQTSFPKTDALRGLRIDAFDSPALHALREALESDDVLGLTVQFNAYRTIYYDTPVTGNGQFGPESGLLVSKLEGGGFQPNPARSMVVGVIGLWRAGEPGHEPGDRVLVTGPAASPQAPTIVTAHARLTGDAITLDLSNSVSETGLDLEKYDFGELTVVAVEPGTGDQIPLAALTYSQYNRDAYLATSGIVTLPVAPAAAAAARSAELQLHDSAGGVLLAETALRAIPLVPNLYLDEGDTFTTQYQVYDRGVPAGAGIPVTLFIMPVGCTAIITIQLETADDGTVSFPVTGTTGSIIAFVPLPGRNPSPPAAGAINPQVHTYMYIRTLPADRAVAQLAPTWDHVYSQVLANWHAMAPCMDNWLDLGNEAQVRSFGPLLKRLTGPDAFEHFRYMPVTRDMTPGQRTLLYRFLDSPAPTPKAVEPLAAEETEGQPSFADLSRGFRSYSP